MAQDPHKINVVVSGGGSTQVNAPGTSSNQITVSQQSATTKISTTPDGGVSTIGFLGVQGVPGSAIYAPGDNGNLLYNRFGYVSGARNFFYEPSDAEIKVSGGSLLLKDSSLVVSGAPMSENAFLIKDSNGKNLLNVDTQNKKITLARSAIDNEYYVGIGVENPSESLHVGENLKVDGNLYVSGNITSLDGNIYVSGNLLPALSGVSSLGSLTKPFKDLYLEGETILFVDKNASIGATDSGFSFQVKKEEEAAFEEIFKATRSGLSFSVENEQGQLQEVFAITAQNATAVQGMVAGDGRDLTGVHYSGITDGGIFLSESIPKDVHTLNVNYGSTLSYDPVVLCAVQPPVNNDNLYFVTTSNISRTSLTASFSAAITGNGYILNCHVSPHTVEQVDEE